jgi:hypothetical protein
MTDGAENTQPVCPACRHPSPTHAVMCRAASEPVPEWAVVTASTWPGHESYPSA